jgi:cytochrome c oxidase assembly protein subunit 15
MMLMLLVQVVLGVVTVLHGAPWSIAILHQLGAVALFTFIVRARFAALYPKAQRIARG